MAFYTMLSTFEDFYEGHLEDNLTSSKLTLRALTDEIIPGFMARLRVRPSGEEEEAVVSEEDPPSVLVLFDVFAEKWLGSLFCGCMYEDGRCFDASYPPVSCQMRILDLFFCQGPHTLLWVVVALFQRLEAVLGEGAVELDALKDAMANVMASLDDPEPLLRAACRLGERPEMQREAILACRASFVAHEHAKLLREAPNPNSAVTLILTLTLTPTEKGGYMGPAGSPEIPLRR